LRREIRRSISLSKLRAECVDFLAADVFPQQQLGWHNIVFNKSVENLVEKPTPD